MEWKCAKQYSAILNAACWVLTKIKNEAEFIVCQQEPHGSLTLSRSFAFQFCNSDLHFWHWCRCEPSVLNDQRGCSLHMLRAPATQKCFPCWLCYQGNILTRLVYGTMTILLSCLQRFPWSTWQKWSVLRWNAKARGYLNFLESHFFWPMTSTVCWSMVL